ncbi:uncharacterized membrane protein YebE (DUF533 family) [Amaricoccus macauensis]|uniref:Uncharacterized membrane protein YebE (DUF533 family) n=1 Tax=Amaricoccus macauensis TaxID=57001 RepID=A0A840SMH4_9RHOB|nr:tellurite resistance TerB family protein [Amaricoccus macauensis]MBB5221940.1 uncharacterized membrane protein YebE (DUF533 family) [Amaricoccus macauensis]
MSLGDILGQIMQQGLGGQTQTRDRLQTTANNLDAQGGGLGGLFGQLQGVLQRAGVDTGSLGGAAQGFGDRARDFARTEQVGGLSGAQLGGIGALAGALLGGGGLGGAARGGAMAILGTLALNALRAAQGGGGAAEAAPVAESEIRALTGPDSEKLALRAMIAAAKADGQIDQDEMGKIIGKISADSVTPEEKQFVLDEMNKPLDVAALAADVRDPAQAAQVYAASILAIDADTEQERAYLRELASALDLNAGAVAQLHKMAGVPV